MKNGLIILALWLAGCATPSERFAQAAKTYGFIEKTLATEHFLHKIYLNRHSLSQTTSLHIYLDGDGSPSQGEGIPATDPTARQQLILSLMAQDAA